MLTGMQNFCKFIIMSSSISLQAFNCVQNPQIFTIANDDQKNEWGVSRSYGIFHQYSAPQLLPNSHPLVKYVPLFFSLAQACICQYSTLIKIHTGNIGTILYFILRLCITLIGIIVQIKHSIIFPEYFASTFPRNSCCDPTEKVCNRSGKLYIEFWSLGLG